MGYTYPSKLASERWGMRAIYSKFVNISEMFLKSLNFFFKLIFFKYFYIILDYFKNLLKRKDNQNYPNYLKTIWVII